jgi:hypothetical protein
MPRQPVQVPGEQPAEMTATEVKAAELALEAEQPAPAAEAQPEPAPAADPNELPDAADIDASTITMAVRTKQGWVVPMAIRNPNVR